MTRTKLAGGFYPLQAPNTINSFHALEEEDFSFLANTHST
ncbi:MAG: hypothetical protein N5P05_003052 [Chroococcopsis gigantea SAG 12.99]|nr:hypothetical protein [Chroococcopsis gigantea SAG 12.99]